MLELLDLTPTCGVSATFVNQHQASQAGSLGQTTKNDVSLQSAFNKEQGRKRERTHRGLTYLLKAWN